MFAFPPSRFGALWSSLALSFVLGATGAILLLASNPHGGEHLKEMLAGQILWVDANRMPAYALVCALILTPWMLWRERLGRIGFYALFACAVTFSVQLVGLYLVFTSLVVPGLATYYVTRARLSKAYTVAALGYALGLGASLWLDLPSGPVIVWVMLIVALPCAAVFRKIGP